MIQIKDKKDCCGCSACVSVCPQNCISLIADAEQFLYPEVDLSKCVNCGLCVNVCPTYSSKEFDLNSAVSYAAINKNENIREGSSSGGVLYEIAKYIIENGGVVYGAAFTENWKVKHIRIDSVEDLHLIQKSKYLQSEIEDSFRQIKEDLKKGIKVLLSGTPCQVAGLTNLPFAKNENLICLDVACHAVPSPIAWNAYLKSAGIDFDKISYLDFRDKNYPWHNYTLTIKSKEGKTISESCDKNPFMLGFIYNLYDRPSCHNCPAKGLTSGSDIMLADFWGIEKMLPDMDDNKGTSLVIVKSERGSQILDAIFEKFRLEKVSNEAFIGRPTTFLKSSAPHYKRDYFFKNVDRKEFDGFVKGCLKHNASLKNRIIRRIKMLVKA